MRKTVSKKPKIIFLGRSDSRILKFLKILGEDVSFEDKKVSAIELASHKFTHLISHGYRHIVPKDVLDLYGRLAINLHISLLPFNRGADPNFWSFVRNTPKGVSAHVMSEGLDEGDIIAQKQLELDPRIHTFKSSYNALDNAMVELFAKIWQDLRVGSFSTSKQPIGGGCEQEQGQRALYAISKRGLGY